MKIISSLARRKMSQAVFSFLYQAIAVVEDDNCLALAGTSTLGARLESS